MSNTPRIIITIALAALCGGCVAPVVTMSSHTIATGEASSKDVLWLRDGNSRPQRCTLEGKAPVCRVAQESP